MIESEEVMQYHYRVSRLTIAWLCALLAPLSVLLGLLGININPEGWWHSISDTYYANSKVIMIGVLSITAFYLATYKGYDWRDRVVNGISAAMALCVALFPCRGYDGLIPITQEKYVPVINVIHGVSAALLFTMFFINCVYLFRLGGSNTEAKKKKNKAFLFCGAGIALAGVLIGLNALFGIDKIIPNIIWIAEFIGLSSYSFAWFVKSNVVFKEDK